MTFFNPFTHSVKRLLLHVQKDELQVQAGPEHEHVAVEFDLSDPTGGQGVTDGHQTHSLIAGLIQRHVHHVLPQLQVTAAVDDLKQHETNTVTDLGVLQHH